MPSPLELYREWEKTGSDTTVHVMQIDRGDNSAANRLTLTDKSYYDKGVSGSKYHDTYPAPVHCIRSDLVTAENFQGTNIEPIELDNGDGRFDALLDGANIIGHRFTVLRGDQSWSLMETDYPYRFVEVFRGQIESVSVDRGVVVLQCVPIKYKLDNVIGSVDAPVHYGKIRNAPGLLVDSATHQYRFSTLHADNDASGSNAGFFLRDNGVQLTASGTDYTGPSSTTLVTLNAAPSGKLTADLSAYDPESPELFNSIRQAIVDNLLDNYIGQAVLDDMGAGSSPPVCLGNGDAKLYRLNRSTDTVYEDDLSTAGDLSTRTHTGNTHVLTNPTTLHATIQSVAANLFCHCDTTSIYELDLSTDWDISSAANGDSFDTTSVLGGGSLCYGFKLIPSLGFLYLLHRDGIVYKLTYTPGNISTATGATVVLRLQPFDGYLDFIEALDFSADGNYVYFLQPDGYIVYQFACLTPFDMDEIYPIGRSYFAHEMSEPIIAQPYSFIMANAGNKFYLARSTALTEYRGITDSLLPRDLVSTNVASTHISNYAGVFYNNEVQIGRVIGDLLTSMIADYTVSRLGNLVALRREDANDALDAWVDTFDIQLSAFRGKTGEHIRHVSTESAKRKITLRYDINFTVQSESELAGAVSEDDRSYYSRPFEITSVTNTLTNYVDPEDLTIDTFLTNQTQAESVRDYVAGLWDEDRQIYDWKTNLSWQTLLSNFGLGSIINVVGDIKHPGFAANDRVQVIGRRVNWSKHSQELRVFR